MYAKIHKGGAFKGGANPLPLPPLNPPLMMHLENPSTASWKTPPVESE